MDSVFTILASALIGNLMGVYFFSSEDNFAKKQQMLTAKSLILFCATLFGALFAFEELGGLWWGVWSLAAAITFLATTWVATTKSGLLIGEVVAFALAFAAVSQIPATLFSQSTVVALGTAVGVFLLITNPLSWSNATWQGAKQERTAYGAVLLFLMWLLTACIGYPEFSDPLIEWGFIYSLVGLLLYMYIHYEVYTPEMSNPFGSRFLDEFAPLIAVAQIGLFLAFSGLVAVTDATLLSLAIIFFISLKQKLPWTYCTSLALQVIVLFWQSEFREIGAFKLVLLALLVFVQFVLIAWKPAPKAEKIA